MAFSLKQELVRLGLPPAQANIIQAKKDGALSGARSFGVQLCILGMPYPQALAISRLMNGSQASADDLVSLGLGSQLAELLVENASAINIAISPASASVGVLTTVTVTAVPGATISTITATNATLAGSGLTSPAVRTFTPPDQDTVVVTVTGTDQNAQPVTVTRTIPVAAAAPVAPSQITTWTWTTGLAASQIVASITAPSDGGSPITGYEYSLDGGATAIPLTGASPWTLTMAAAGTSYTAVVRARNAIGAGAWSTSKTATSGAAAATAPAQFGTGDWSVATGASASQVTLTVSALPSNGGSPITALQYTIDGGTTWTALSGTGTGARTLTMAAANTAYTFAVRAVNAVGAGTASATKTATSGAATATVTPIAATYEYGGVKSDAANLTYTPTARPAGASGMIVAVAAPGPNVPEVKVNGLTTKFLGQELGVRTVSNSNVALSLYWSDQATGDVLMTSGDYAATRQLFLWHITGSVGSVNVVSSHLDNNGASTTMTNSGLGTVSFDGGARGANDLGLTIAALTTNNPTLPVITAPTGAVAQTEVSSSTIRLRAFINSGSGDGAGSVNLGNISGFSGGSIAHVRIAATDQGAGITVDSAPGYGYVYPVNNAHTTTSVPITGKAFGGATGIVQARVIDRDGAEVITWADLATIASGSYSGTISIPKATSAMKFLRAEVRLKATPSVVAKQVGTWRCGFVIVGYGQSNSAGMTNFSATDVLGAAGYIDSLTQVSANANAAGVCPDACGWGALARELATHANMPSRIVSGGASGATIGVIGRGTLFAQRVIDKLGLFGIAHAFVWHHGESNTQDASVPATAESYATAVSNLYDDIAAAVGKTKATLPMFTSSLGTYGNNESQVGSSNWWSNMNTLIRSYGSLWPNVVYCGSNIDMVRVDQYHSRWPGYGKRGRRIGREIAATFGLTTSLGHFQISAAAKNGATGTNLTLILPTGATDISLVDARHKISTGSGGTGTVLYAVPTDADYALNPANTLGSLHLFEVSSDAGATWVPATATRTDATHIALSHADMGTGARLVRFAWGYGRSTADQSGYAGGYSGWTLGIPMDNTGYSIPLEHLDSLAVA